MLDKKATLMLFSIFSYSCSGLDYEGDLKSVQQRDKNLSCKQLLLEINEASFSSKMDYSKKVSKALKERSDYLNTIYNTVNCNGLDDYIPNDGKGTLQAQSPQILAPYPTAYYNYNSLPVYPGPGL